MKVNKKILIIVLVILIPCITIIGMYVKNYMSTSNLNSIVNKENLKNQIKSLSIMYEIDDGTYVESSDSTWPTDGYSFNEALSRCENGGKLIWDDVNKEVILTSKISDKCYVYFDKKPDIYIATSNVPTTVGKVANITSSDATAAWNNKYNRLEISTINTKYATLNLNFSNVTTKTMLNQHVISLAGTDQGNGKVVDEENANVPDYTSSSPVVRSTYESISQYSSTSNYATAGTATLAYSFSGTDWSTDASEMASDTYYHFKFSVQTSGYYQVCYTMSAGSWNNSLYLYKNGTQIGIHILASTSASTSGCRNLGYVLASNTILIVQGVGTVKSTISFNIQKASNVDSVDTGYRYEGKNPNNYVWFNNELWRIIGVFGAESHGQNGKDLVKIIRANSIGGLAWDKSNVNDWTRSSLKSLLNGSYYDALDGTERGYCYGYGNYNSGITGNCDYREIGIQDVYRGMVENVTWYLGDWSTNAETAEAFYGYERGGRVLSSYPTSVKAPIGLMYPSDYGYSVLSSSCYRTTRLSSYNTAACGGQSWLYGQGDEWMLLSYMTIDPVFSLNSNGNLTNGNASYGYAVRPVLYLNSSVYVMDGDGSMSNPYIIAKD